MKLNFYVILSFAGFAVLFAVGMLSENAFRLYTFACSLLFPVACMMLCPLDHENSMYYLAFASALLVVSLVCMMLRLAGGVPLAVLVACVSDCALRSKRKFSKVRNLFRSNEVWNNVEDYSHLMMELLFFLLTFLIFLASTLEGTLSVIVLSLLIMLLASQYWIMYRRKSESKSYFIGKKKEKLIKSIANSNLRDPQDFEESENNRRMNMLYKKALDNMSEKKPYLDDSFNLEDFARTLYTNKVYLSRTINAFSGRNFRQFTNYFRVRYSIELMKKDPLLKIEEVALMSGFHTVVSYNMSFKLFMDETPSEWMRQYKRSL